MLFTFFPPAPIIRFIFSGLTFITWMSGAYFDSSLEGGGEHFDISARMCFRPSFACKRACFMIGSVIPPTFMSI
uniref:Uncharacterized protein n=1 Tax=Solanum lycopersicum TaxID=4081 RepID=A0A3Q7HNF4_SOLLC